MSALERIRTWVRHPEIVAHPLPSDDALLRDAAVALLLETGWGDSELAGEERDAIREGIEREFGVSELEAATFMDSAAGVRPPAHTLRELTQVVARGLDTDQKIRLMALLWTVVRADHRIARFERVFADHVAAALGLTPVEWKRARSLADA